MYPFPSPMLATTAFSPILMPGVVGWWDSTDTTKLIVSSGNVVSWTDNIAGKQLTPGTAITANPPTAGVTGGILGNQTVVRFQSGEYLTNASTPTNYPKWDGSDDLHVLWAGREVTNGTGFIGCVAHWDWCGAGYLGPSTSTDGFGTIDGTAAGTLFNSSAATAGTTVGIDGICSLERANATLAGAGYWFNGSSRAVADNASGSTPGSDQANRPLEFGRRVKSTTEYINAYIGDVIIAKNISSADRQKLEGYLAWKFGAQGSLPGGHPYKGRRP